MSDGNEDQAAADVEPHIGDLREKVTAIIGFSFFRGVVKAALCDEYLLLIIMEYYRRPFGDVKKSSGRPRRGPLGEKPLPRRTKNHGFPISLIM
ncbi:MAG: hypothetical protein Q8O91_11485 [Candidatus Aminicenantes bacterium]|nr:hypothetical protein [Candidatus Aminicenantes bacterium]